MAFLFASDLHLDAAAPAATAALLRWLESITQDTEALYLLGDLFETWIGDDDPDPHHERVCAALRRCTARGTPVFVIRGNRDFLLGPGFEARTGCRLLPDPVIALLHGERVLLTHGDLLCTDDLAYQELRTTVRGAAWQQRVLKLSIAARRWLSGAARAGSKAHTAMQRPVIMDVNANALERAVRAAGVSWVIHGHTHRPAVHDLQIDGRRVRRVVLDSWYERASALRFEHGQVEVCPLPYGAVEAVGGPE